MTLNRLVQTIVPVLMGAVAEGGGLNNGFPVSGGVLFVGIALFTLLTWGPLSEELRPPPGVTQPVGER